MEENNLIIYKNSDGNIIVDAIIAVGYRINSKKASEFRIWATKVLKEYMIKGFALNDERFIKDEDLIGNN